MAKKATTKKATTKKAAPKKAAAKKVATAAPAKVAADAKVKAIAPFELGDISNPKKIEAEFSDLDTFISNLPMHKKNLARLHYESSHHQFNPKGDQFVNETLIRSAVGKINRDLEE